MNDIPSFQTNIITDPYYNTDKGLANVSVTEEFGCDQLNSFHVLCSQKISNNCLAINLINVFYRSYC